jgi:polyhydroxybutyrate depolymerase
MEQGAEQTSFGPFPMHSLPQLIDKAVARPVWPLLRRLTALGITLALLGASTPASAQRTPDKAAPNRGAKRVEAALKDLTRRQWTVGETAREALLFVPAAAKTTPTPVVFAFHGHGGTMQRAAVMFDYHRAWPEAIVVYMQGLNTPGRLTDPEGKRPGWQHSQGSQGDRDLKFFDAVLTSLKADYKLDENRIYATGHSNGGGFTYLLWRERGDVFAAVAPSAAAGPGPEWVRRVATLKPKPVLHLAGEMDTLVKYEWQQQTMEALRKLNGCEASGMEWDKRCTLYPSKTGTPVVTLIHPGGHGFPPEAPAIVVKFFKQHSKP